MDLSKRPRTMPENQEAPVEGDPVGVVVIVVYLHTNPYQILIYSISISCFVQIDQMGTLHFEVFCNEIYDQQQRGPLMLSKKKKKGPT